MISSFFQSTLLSAFALLDFPALLIQEGCSKHTDFPPGVLQPPGASLKAPGGVNSLNQVRAI